MPRPAILKWRDMNLPRTVLLLAKPIPLPAVQAVASAALRALLKKHPKLFDRLGEHAAKTFAFAPTDIPFAFAVAPLLGTITVTRPGRVLRADATISGPLVLLLAVAEGRVDGDAEFFARELSITGDMEAVLALRNAIDDCGIDLPSDLAPSRGPLRRPVEASLQAFRTLMLSRGSRKWS